MNLKRYKEAREELKQIFREAGPENDLSKVKSIDGTDGQKAKKIRGLNDELEVFNAEYAEIEKDLAGKGGGHPFPEGAGYRTAGSPAPTKGWKSGYWADAFVNEAQFGTKGLLTSGTATVPSLTGGIVPIADRPLSILDVVPSRGLGETDTYAYLREETREHKAAETGKGKLKPTSTYKVKKYEATAKTIAHVSEPVARQDLEDAELLRGYVEGSLREGVMLRLQEAIMSGKGEGEELTGISKTSGIQEQAFSSNRFDSARAALTKLEEVNIFGGVFVMPLAQWEKYETTRTEQGIYLQQSVEGPVNRGKRQLWGQPVIPTPVLTGKKGFLVDFAGSTQLYERATVRIDWSEAPVGSESGKSAFLTNELIWRGEGRWGFAVTRPKGVCEFGCES